MLSGIHMYFYTTSKTKRKRKTCFLSFLILNYDFSLNVNCLFLKLLNYSMSWISSFGKMELIRFNKMLWFVIWGFEAVALLIMKLKIHY